MKAYPSCISKVKNQSGVSAVVVAIGLVMLLGFAALAIDVGYLYSTRNELQNVSDATALAATRQLGSIYQSMSYQDQQNYVCDRPAIVSVAQQVGLKNQAAKTFITINDADVVIGKWNSGTLTPTLAQPDAVGVIARRDRSANSPVTTIFAAIFNTFGGNFDTVGITADAVAALSGKGESHDGEIELPVAIDEDWFNTNPGNVCGDQIKFSPTTDPDACAGWTSFEISPSNDITLRRILQEMMDIPSTSVGVTQLNMIGGDLSVPTFDALLTLFQYKGYDVHSSAIASINDISLTPTPAATDAAGNPVPFLPVGSPNTTPLFDDDGVTPLLYPDGTARNVHIWDTYVAVYSSSGCSNPNQVKDLVGYAEIRLTDIKGPPDKLLQGILLCNGVDKDDNRGGGGNFGLKGSIPGLVE
ncbi:MAG: pilus assembly protein TadG-related protein, partial [Desulfobacterales bacterium]|jgi:Flp pilus assembly protein TadG